MLPDPQADLYPYFFEAPVEKYDFGKYHYTVVYLPAVLMADLPLSQFSRLRIEAVVDGACLLEGALMPDTLGSPQTRHLLSIAGKPGGPPQGERIWYFMLPRQVLRTLGKSLGEVVSLRFRVADQDAVDIPQAVQELLERHETLREVWERLTPGKRRGLVHGVRSARSEETRLRRLEDLENQLLDLR